MVLHFGAVYRILAQMTVNTPLRPAQKNTASAGLYLALFLFLFGLYLLTYTPRINSSDGLAMFATAESIIRRGALDVEQIRWMGLQQGTYGLDGLLYSRKGIGVPLGLLPLTWLGLTLPGVGPVSTSLLFNAIVTALTAVFLMAYVHALEYSRPVGLIVALSYGIATPAWPYAKSLFSDPFSGLLLLAAAFFLYRFSRTPDRHQWRAYGFLAGAGILLGWNVATRYAELLFVPLFGLLLLYYLLAPAPTDANRHPAFVRDYIYPLVAFTIPILLAGVGLILFNVVRYGNPLNTGYLPEETFSAIWLEGIAGQLISPGRGLLLYTPLLVLSFAGVFPFLRRHRAESLLALAIILIHLLLYGKWFMWHGGYAWGPRFLIPTLPFWALLLAPVAGWSITNALWRAIYWALFGLSLLPQVLTVTLDFAPFLNALLDTGLPLFARETFFQWQYSPLIAGWDFITSESLDTVWAWQGQWHWGLLVVLLTNVVITAVVVWQANRPETEAAKRSLLPVALLTGAAAVGSLLLYTHQLTPPDIIGAVDMLNSRLRPAGAVITNEPDITAPFAEQYRGNAPVLGLNSGGYPLPDDITRRLDEVIARHNQVWWLPNWLPATESAVEQTLQAEMVRVSQSEFGARRLVLFARPPDGPAQTIEETFDDGISLATVRLPTEGIFSGPLTLELQWQATTTPATDYHVFVHVVNQAGQTLAQSDGQPAQWQRPTTTWQAGETITDRHGLWLPEEVVTNTLTLRVGLYNPATGERLALVSGANAVVIPLSGLPE